MHTLYFSTLKDSFEKGFPEPINVHKILVYKSGKIKLKLSC